MHVEQERDTKLMKPNPMQVEQECGICKRFTYGNTLNKNFNCNHIMCTVCVPEKTKKCPLCHSRESASCILFACFQF